MSIFTLEKTEGEARAGVLHTPHGDVPTPVFMPVATQGSVKALDPADLKAIGARIVLGNTYHLYLRPGVEIIEGLGGLGRFMGWQGPVLTDSGGFQGFSLEHLREITEDGILFTSHVDGSPHNFTPEAVIDYQERMGSDLIMPLDVCVPSTANRAAVEEAVQRTGALGGPELEGLGPAGPGPLRHSPGWLAARPAGESSEPDHVHGVPWLRNRRSERRGVQGPDV